MSGTDDVRCADSFGAQRWTTMRMAGALLPLVAGLVIPVSAAGALPAFPGAQGAGATTPGGRGGAVYKVTRLDDYSTKRKHPDFQPGCASLGERSENWMANRMGDARGAKQWHGTVGNEMDEIVRAE